MITKSVNIGTTSTYKDDYNVNVEYQELNGKFVLTGSSYYGRAINVHKGREFNSLDELVKFSKTFLKNILD